MSERPLPVSPDGSVPSESPAAGAMGWRRLAMVAAAVVFCLLCALVGGRAAYRSAIDSRLGIATQGLASFSSALSSLLARYESLPRLVSLDPRIVDLLSRPVEPGTREAANLYLDAVAKRGGLSAVFVMKPDGLTLASSNWNTPQSFVGRNYGFRPYVRDALSDAGDGTGRFYAIGKTTSEPGYFISSVVRDQADAKQVLGLVIVKVDLQQLQAARSANGEAIAVLDAAGVIFLSSDPALRYRTLAPLKPATHEQLAASEAYGKRPLEPLDANAAVESVPAEMLLDGERRMRTIAQVIEPLNWRVLTFVELAPAWRAAFIAALGGGSAAALVLGLLAFVTLRRERTAELERSRDGLFRTQERLRAVADGLPVMVCFIDRRGRYVFANTAFAQHHGVTVAAIEGRTTMEFVPEEDRNAVAPYFARAWGGETVVFEREYRDQRGFRCFEATYRPEWNASRTAVVGVHVMTQDVTETRRRLDELSRLSQLDHLTELLNRKGFDARLSNATSRASGACLALLFIDLDNFKPVNDVHGHPAGDAVLKAFSKRLTRLVRASDAVARVGGDEFAVILPDIATPEIAERLASAVARMAATPFDVAGVMVQVGASVGVAVALPGITADALCKRADGALYEAKKLGKGRFHLDAAVVRPEPATAETA